jgi:hypothetical protein
MNQDDTPRPGHCGPSRLEPRVEWRKRYDETLAHPTPLHPEDQGGSVEHINGPLVKSSYAVGSLEWQRQKDGEG